MVFGVKSHLVDWVISIFSGVKVRIYVIDEKYEFW